MRKLYTLGIVLGFIGAAQAQIVEKPLKLEGQAENDKNNGAIVFPPATEPYQPVETRASTAPAERAYQAPPQVAQPLPYQQPVAQPVYQQPMQQPVQQQAFNSAPATSYGGSYASREALERAAANCEADLGQVWQDKTRVDMSRRAQFQKSMGEAKKYCDQLKEAAKAFKQADYSLYTYESNLQQARNSFY